MSDGVSGRGSGVVLSGGFVSASRKLLKSGRLNPWLEGYEIKMTRYPLDRQTALELARNATIREKQMVRTRRAMLRFYFRRIQREVAILEALRPMYQPTLEAGMIPGETT